MINTIIVTFYLLDRIIKLDWVLNIKMNLCDAGVYCWALRMYRVVDVVNEYIVAKWLRAGECFMSSSVQGSIVNYHIELRRRVLTVADL